MKRAVKRPLLWYIKQLRRPIFTTYELRVLSGRSSSTITQTLSLLDKRGIIFKIYRGIWGEIGRGDTGAYAIIPFLFPRQRAYVSFISALHLHGIIEQIPQVITLASLSHTKTIHTKIGTFSIHKIHPRFFDGFNWHKKEGAFLIAEPEKALIDSLYISSRRKKQFSHFPELHFPKSFSFKKAEEWVKRIPEYKIRVYVGQRLKELMDQNGAYA